MPAVRAVQFAGYVVAVLLLLVLGWMLLRDGNGGSSASPESAQRSGDVLRVGEGRDYATISEALEAARTGDIVEVGAGVYHESVRVTREIVIQATGDGDVWIDGDCDRDIGVYFYSGDGSVISGLGVRNTNGPAVLIGNTGDDARSPQHITVEHMTLQDFNCTNNDDQFNAGVAVWHGRCCMRITDNTIVYRTEGDAHGRGNGIWFKSTDDQPSGGDHLIARNTIIGGWDGIGGEAEGDVHGSFDQNTIIRDNVISGCWDDGIQSEGGNANVTIRDNEISGCGTGIAFTPTITGPLKVADNTIRDLETGLYDNRFCFKAGGEGEGEVRLTGNVCDTTGDGILQTNSGLPVIIAKENCFQVTRYVIQLGDEIREGTLFDGNTLWTTDPDRFVEWGGERFASLDEFRQTGQESSGRESPAC